MHFIEVLEYRWQLIHDRLSIRQIHAAAVIAPERVDEALGHAVALRTAHRRVGLSDDPETASGTFETIEPVASACSVSVRPAPPEAN